MTQRHNIFWLLLSVLVGSIWLSGRVRAADDGADHKPVLVDTNHSINTQLRPVPLDAVLWTNGFWAERYIQSREVSLHKLWDLAADPEAGHVLDNMRIAGALKEGEFAGTDWQDAWLYKWIESAAAYYAITRDPWIKERMDSAIELIEAAQEDDGYIATQITAQGKPRFTDPREHEVYNMGHLLTAACVHHRATGEDSLLKVATRCGDYLCETLGVSVPPCFAHNPSAVMGLVELYRETGERKYLDCAKMIVDRRGEAPKQGVLFYKGPGIEGTDLIQDRTPLRKSSEVVGHNVFFTYLYAGAADVYLEDGDPTLWLPLDRLWSDLTEKKMCINGGVSPMGHGLSKGNDPVCEAVGPSYYLPCADSYNETCGQIGNMMWNYRMLCAKPDVKYADTIELELYNGFLAGVGLDGESWFYRNSLRFNDDSSDLAGGHNFMAERGQPGRRQICCPTNLLRTVAELQSYVYSLDDEGLWIHHFGGNTADISLANGKRLKLTQKTDYPWDEKIVITLEEVDTGKPFTIRVRIPGWADGATVAINNQPSANTPDAGQYLFMKRTWKSGDVIEMNLPMPVLLMQAHPKAEQLRNQVAVRRGPLLYCLESKDLPDGVDLNNVYIPDDIQLTPQAADDLPFGIVTLAGKALYREELSWNNDLYRKVERYPMKPLQIRMVPYFAWANRGPGAMSVWLPVVWSK